MQENQFIMEQRVGAISRPSDDTLDPKGNYKLLQSLGEGGFGQVVQCYKKDTNEHVAVKIFKSGRDSHREWMILNYIRGQELEKHNIVKFIDSFTLMNDEVALAFEKLDVTLTDYIAVHRDFIPMELCDIRSVVQQLAIALDALKTFKVIHTDIKTDNIMLVDREAQPLVVKLIDFGLAMPARLAERMTPRQTKHFRAPEIFLGLPFSEAIDMWSAGVVMSVMMLNNVLFRGTDDYDIMRWIVAFRGVPPHHLLNAATKSQHYFIIDASGHWRLKTPEEYWQDTTVPSGYRPLHFDGLDFLEDLPQENLRMVGAGERRECIDLLKAMLEIDPSERIDPSQVLTHPFITRGTLHKGFDTSQSPETPSVSPGVIDVRPTSRTCILTSEEEVEPETSRSATDGLHASSSETLAPGVITVMPASPERHLSGIEDSGQSESRPLDCLENVSENPPVEPTPPSTGGVIMVQPAPPECCLSRIEDSGQSESRPLDCQENGSANPPVEPTPLSTGGVIMVKPAPPECRLWGIEGSGQSESCPLDCLENVSANPPVEPTLLAIEDVEQEPSATASEDTAPRKKKEKRKRNCLKRFLAWTRRTFCCCIPANDDD